MNRLISICLIIILILTLCACKDEKENSKSTSPETEQSEKHTETEHKTESVKIIRPKATSVTSENSENKLGARYIFTLKEYNDMLNDKCKSLGSTSETDFFEYENWKIMSDNLTDDNGVKYESYCYATDMLTITVAVEKESGKVMNISCGAPYEQFEDGTDDFQYNIILTSAILSMVAGGYEQDSLEFLYCIFYDSAKDKKKFYYENNMYMMDYSKSENDASVVLFMTSPCSKQVVKDWKLVDYTTYEGTYKPAN